MSESGLPGTIAEHALGEQFRAYVEAHIEQGPVLERAGRRIGVVAGVQGVRQFEFRVTGEAAHAGTTPLDARRNAFVTALDLYRRLVEIADTADPAVRFTMGRMQVLPGAPNSVPSS